MAAKTVYTDEYAIEGIFLLDKDDLTALDLVIDSIEKEFKSRLTRQLNSAVKKQLEHFEV